MTCCVWCLLTVTGKSCTFGLKSFLPRASRPEWGVSVAGCQFCTVCCWLYSVWSVAGSILYSLVLALFCTVLPAVFCTVCCWLCSVQSVAGCQFSTVCCWLYSLLLAVSSLQFVAGSVLYSLLLALFSTVCCWLCSVRSVAVCQLIVVSVVACQLDQVPCSGVVAALWG